MDTEDNRPGIYKKYLEKYDPKSPKNIEARRKETAKKRKRWWADNWIGFSGLAVAIAALAVSVIALLRRYSSQQELL